MYRNAMPDVCGMGWRMLPEWGGEYAGIAKASSRLLWAALARIRDRDKFEKIYHALLVTLTKRVQNYWLWLAPGP